MSSNIATSSTRPSAWPRVIAGYFALVIIGIACFVTWAVRQNMDLVRSDYYEQEILFQNHIDAASRTKALGDAVVASYDAGAQSMLIGIPAAHLLQNFSGKVHFYRPADARLDRHFDLRPTSAGQETFDTSKLAAGLWKVRVEWSAHSEAYLFEKSIVIQ